MESPSKLTGYPSVDRPWLKYYSEEALKAPHPNLTLYDYIYQKNKDNLSGIAFQYFKEKITYSDFFERIARVADAFYSYGIRKGDIVTIMSMHTPETIISVYALNFIGAVANLVYMTLSEQEILNTVKNTDSKLLMILDTALNKTKNIQREISVPIIVLRVSYAMPTFLKIGYNIKNSAALRTAKNEKYLSLDEFLLENTPKDNNKATQKVNDPAAPAIIVYTSGTTGEPKGVMLSSHSLNMISEQRIWTDRNDKRGEKMLCIIPIFLGYGITMLHVYIAAGFCTDLFIITDADAIGKEFARFRPERIITGPPLLDGIMRHPGEDLSNVIEVTGGGSGISPEKEDEFNAFLKAHGSKAKYLSGYGMTEFGSAVMLNMEYAYKRNSLGVPLRDAVVKIEDPDTREELPYNQTGEICISTPSMMLGYYKNEDSTREIIKTDENGVRWLRTGDLGYVDEDGFVFIKGRIKRIYMTRGSDGVIYRIFCQRIEELACTDKSVNMCGAVAIPDEERINAPVLYVSLKGDNKTPDQEQVITSLNELMKKELPEHMRPTAIHILDKLPVAASGKIDYRTLEKLAAEK